MKNLTWNTCDGDKWCSFERVNLNHSHFDEMCGVYVIWHGGDKPRTIRVGQGDIRNRIDYQRTNPDVTAYSKHGLFVTWAQVPENEHDGVERYLSDLLKPLTGDRWPDVDPIPVNSPFK